jgi:hypothetical protein
MQRPAAIYDYLCFNSYSLFIVDLFIVRYYSILLNAVRVHIR